MKFTVKHGASHGGEFAREYRIWKNMRTRCNNQRSRDYARYGGRGITICDRWNDFELFLADMGKAPTAAHTLDRKDCNSDYEPGNCRWATQTEQQRNRRNNKLTLDAAEEIRGLVEAGHTHASIAGRYGISRSLVGLIARGKSWAKPRPEQPSLFGGGL